MFVGSLRENAEVGQNRDETDGGKGCFSVALAVILKPKRDKLVWGEYEGKDCFHDYFAL